VWLVQGGAFWHPGGNMGGLKKRNRIRILTVYVQIFSVPMKLSTFWCQVLGL